MPFVRFHKGPILLAWAWSLISKYKVGTQLNPSLNQDRRYTDPFLSIPHGLGVRIAGSHPAGPGSIPGVGNLFLSSKK